jgi:hypothetical protein
MAKPNSGEPRWVLLLMATTLVIPLGCGGPDVGPSAGPGSLVISTSTHGPGSDEDGFTVALDGVVRAPIGMTAGVQLDSIEVGTHTVGLEGMTPNCGVESLENPRSVVVTAGDTAGTHFEVWCTHPFGTLEVTTRTTGPSPDPDGYTVDIVYWSSRTIAVNAVLEVDHIAAGPHPVSLSGLAANCRVEGENFRDVVVGNGTTTAVSFDVVCSSFESIHWTSIPLGTDFIWTDLWGSSATDLFVIGSRGTTSVIRHYDGQTWTEQFRRDNAALSGIWGSSASDVFVASSRSILHYDGYHWSDMVGSTPADPGKVYKAVWGASRRPGPPSGDAVYAGGAELLMHYDGISWAEITTEGLSGRWSISQFSGTYLFDVYAAGDRPVCAGCDGREAFVAHYDGTRWSTINTRAGAAGADSWFRLWVGQVRSNDVWAVNTIWHPTNESERVSTVEHYDGAAWTTLLRRTPADASNEDVRLEDIWGTSGSDLYVVGTGGILHYDGTGWTEINSSPGTRILGIPSQGIFVLGTDVVLHGKP